MTNVFIVLLVSGFSVLVASKLFLRRPGVHAAFIKILFWAVGGFIYSVGMFGQIGVLFGASDYLSWLISLIGTCASAWIVYNMALHAIGFKYKPDVILGKKAKVYGEWKDRSGIISIDLDGHVFTRIASSDTYHKQGSTVEIIEVDAKTKRVKVRSSN